MQTNSSLTLHFTIMVKLQISQAGRRIVISFPTERSATKFVLDTAGAIQKLDEEKEALKLEIESLKKQLEEEKFKNQLFAETQAMFEDEEDAERELARMGAF